MPIKPVNLFNINRKPKLKEPEFEILNGNKVIKKLIARDNQNQPVTLRTIFGTSYTTNPSYTTEILRKNEQKPIAYNNFWISETTNTLYGWMMSVDFAFRKTSGYGELLRLASIIDLNENLLNKISITALAEAIPFHHKFKFKPHIPFHKDDCEDLLMKISKQENPELKICKEKSINLLDEICNAGFLFDNNMHANFTKKINKLVSEYLQIVESNKLDWKPNAKSAGTSFDTDIDMKLDSDAIFIHRDFFNDKFIKHGIDYEI